MIATLTTGFIFRLTSLLVDNLLLTDPRLYVFTFISWKKEKVSFLALLTKAWRRTLIELAYAMCKYKIHGEGIQYSGLTNYYFKLMCLDSEMVVRIPYSHEPLKKKAGNLREGKRRRQCWIGSPRSTEKFNSVIKLLNTISFQNSICY